jgi:hypothetical protein
MASRLGCIRGAAAVVAGVAGVAILGGAVSAGASSGPGHRQASMTRPAVRPAARPATFKVGAATVRINPHVTTYSGGFGASPPIRPGHVAGDPLSARAIYISNGHRAIELAVVDSQAEFAAYQEGPRFGITAARAAAARAIDRSGHGPRMQPSDIIIQATHSHSAPTLEGLWGPVPVRYLRRVTQAETTALVKAARHARRASLQFGTANASRLDDVEVAQYDAFPGWADDPLLTALRAVDARTGATIATYTTVPAHPDIVCGACSGTETADYQGMVRRALQRQLGGVALVGPATLGREETPVQATSIANAKVFSRDVTALVDAAIRHSRPLADDRIAATQRFTRIPGTGAALLALIEANHLSPAGKKRIQASTGEYPIDRADTPPYQTGSVIGTWTTALRLGNIAYLSMPGEPFPEIRESLAAATTGATVVALSKGQDDLGYFYPSYVTPLTETYPSDTLTNSGSAEVGDDVMSAQAANLRALGFDTATVLPRPVSVDPSQQGKPGLQVVGGPFTTDAGRHGRGRVRLLATYSPPDLPTGTLDYGLPTGSAPAGVAPSGPVHWRFGDGSTGTSGYHEFAGTDRKPVITSHAFPTGRHTVHAVITSADGRPASTSFVVRVFPRLRVHVHRRATRRRVVLRAGARGGDGRVLAARWRLPNGHAVAGRRLVLSRRAAARLGRIRVTVTDGTGTRATTTARAR